MGNYNGGLSVFFFFHVKVEGERRVLFSLFYFSREVGK